MRCVFYQATALGTAGNWQWDVSNVTDMRYAFWLASSFNGDITTWNTSNVTNMKEMLP